MKNTNVGQNEVNARGNKRRVRDFAILTALIAVGALGACTPQRSASMEGVRLLGNDDRIFSTRPQINTFGVYLIKLKNPALLTTMTVDKTGKKILDKDLAKAIDDEQIALIAKVKALSSDIKVLYKYRMVLNAVAVVAPGNLSAELGAIGNVLFMENDGHFKRPVLPTDVGATVNQAVDLAAHNSVKFIGATDAHARGVSGQGMKIGIIDTGIDYTHAMFGGEGTEAAYKAVDPNLPNAAFPGKKVVGGIDLVGTNFNTASADFNARIPVPDTNPIDEAGHGTHVAGTVAGIGDNVNTYTGVAPEASLYAVKVFGKVGSTGDATVIAALEYAADPTFKGDLTDQLDVVNLSLGGGYGEKHILYNEAIGNLSKAGTVVVCAAGNDGDTEYIVSAPAVSEDALSVAATLDDQDANYKFSAVSFLTADGATLVAGEQEAEKSKQIKDAGDVTGEIVYAGNAATDFTDEMKAKLKGKIAFLDRGVSPFEDKAARAKSAGVIGLVVGNNVDGEPIQMGLTSDYEFPAVMIKQEDASKVKAALQAGAVVMHFKSSAQIAKPELIDTIASFSSKGPRSFDALIKPEISAPGSLTVSAKMGGGAAGVQMSGTSMATPHMAGVMALLKQTHPTLSSAELKSIAMGTSKTLVDVAKAVYPVSRQGAGRIQVLAALDAKIVTLPSALSLGETTIETRKTLQKTLSVHNISADALTLDLKFEGSSAVQMQSPAAITLKAGESQTLNLRFVIDASSLTVDSTELDGWLKMSAAGTEVNRVPVLAVVNKIAQVQSGRLAIRSTSNADSQGAVVDLDLKNTGVNSGDAYLFNLIALDRRKQDPTHDNFRSKACDLQGAGYRVIQRGGKSVMQVAFKLFEPESTWANCELSVLIDTDGDGQADQELVGTLGSNLKGYTQAGPKSMLLDATKARAIRRQFELDSIAKKDKIKEDYSDALIASGPMTAIAHSTIAIVEADVEDLGVNDSGALSVQIAASSDEQTAAEADDFLVKDQKTWLPLNVGGEGAGYADLPEKVTIAKGQTQTVSFVKGAGDESLWLLYPQNRTIVGGLGADSQSQVLSPVYDTDFKAVMVATPTAK